MFYLYLNSKDRTTNSLSNINFRVDLSRNIINAKRISLISLSLPNRILNINASNNQFDFDDGVARNFTIPNGVYSATELATELQTQMNAVSAGYSVSYSAIRDIFTFSNAGAFTLLFSNTDNPYALLGFPNADTASATTHSSSLGTEFVKQVDLAIDIDVIKKTCLTSNPISRIHTFIIPRDGSNLITFNMNSQYLLSLKNEQVNITEMNISLSRSDGNTLYFDPNVEWSMVLALD
jgi:hypothetical protein